MIKRIIAVVALLALLLSMTTLGTISAAAADTDWFEREPAKNVDYSFAVLGDIQTITFKDAHGDSNYLGALFDWIVNNREARKIEYVIGLGDTVETLRSNKKGAERNPKEWQTAAVQLAKLNEAQIPNLIVLGNHDDEYGYHQYVCTEAYQAQMDGFFYDSEKLAAYGNSMSNCYKKIEIGNHKYLMIGLDYHIGEGVVEWANALIEANPDYKVILSMHSYLSSNGSFYKDNIGFASPDFQVQESMAFNAQELWNDLVSKHANMFMVLSGHAAITHPMLRVTTGKNGNKVYKVLVDPQAYEKSDPSGFVYMINIVNGGSAVEIEYLSTVKNKYFGETNQMVLELAAGTLPEYIPSVKAPEKTTAESTTEVPVATTVYSEEATTAETTEASSGGCRGAVISTMAVCCSIGTSLAAFAMRRRKED